MAKDKTKKPAAKKPKRKRLPADWEDKISEVTGLNFCGEDCGCGENAQLWYFDTPRHRGPDWVPGWMNGADTDSIWEWLVENGKV